MRQIILEVNLIVLVELLVIFSLVTSSLEYKEYKLEYGDLCSPITKRKFRLTKDEGSALIVTQSRLQDHFLEWNVNFNCKFEVQTAFPRNGGIIAVIQYLNFRKNYATDECIDFIQFRPKDGPLSEKFCGTINATVAMNKHDVDPTKQLAYEASFIDYRGEMNVYISISKKPLEHNENSNLKVVFTSYKHCIKGHSTDLLLPCSDKLATFCIYKDFFKDGIVNCPYIGCTDEGGCIVNESLEKRSIGNKVLAGSISALFFIFFIFVLCIWSCKKHQVLCWSEDFANPSTTVAEAEANAARASRVMEMNEQTGARLANAPNVPTAPPQEDDKDLPPSYESLFPDSR